MDIEKARKALRGIEMSRGEIDQFLTEEGVGVICLADGNKAYGVPLSFGYDGDNALYFWFVQFGDDSRKIDFSRRTEDACFVVYTAETQHKWKSVTVFGGLTEVSEDRRKEAEDVLFDNAWFPNLFPYGEPIKGGIRYRMDIDDVSGQKGRGYE